jgi:AAA+ superfamily predicted ATPase
VRNAMVCVMLRLLEYYSGILFLTTNRVESIDPAFQSRVQCALRYNALDNDSRASIWRDVLRHVAGGKVENDVDIESLAKHELNGRQIKNCLQLALALSLHEGADKVAMRHLEETVAITTAFVNETTSINNSN